MKKLLQLSLGVVTSVGGFVETGSIATSAQAGAAYGFQLLWALVLGTICLIFLVEMSGRFAIASRHTIGDAVRERFGFNLFAMVLVINLLVGLLVLASEIGGVALGLQFLSGVGFQWWALPTAFVVWLLLWRGTFGVIENGVSSLGLVALSIVVGAVLMHPSWRDVGAGALPSLPDEGKLHFAFLAVSIVGATIAPFLLFFYSSGAIEDGWDTTYFGVNRAIATFGMTFGAAIAAAVVIAAAMVFPAHGIEDIESYDQIALILTPSLGKWGFYLFALSLTVTCFGAALELSLSQAYLVAQGFGWNWSENSRPKDDPGFSLVYTGALLIAVLPIVFGMDPLKLTVFSMALTAASLPFGIVPFLFLMNDSKYVRGHRNGWIGNAVVVCVIGLAFLVAIVAIPLQIWGS